VGICPEEFEKELREKLKLDDWVMEHYPTPIGQRAPSMKFFWGHNHDFGTFKLSGRMQDRHIHILQWAVDHGMPTDLTGKRVLDIGPWTGGMSLILYAMNPTHLLAVEEVVKYAEMIRFLRDSFALGNLSIFSDSLYNLSDFRPFWITSRTTEFDLINFCGVLYHITDIPVALKLLANSLKVGGMMMLETGICGSNDKVVEYAGPSKSGPWNWNWFFPSVTALHQMLKDVGLVVRNGEKLSNMRYRAICIKKEQVPFMLCGASRRIE
jgi:SAM-dependent methyltransferase